MNSDARAREQRYTDLVVDRERNGDAGAGEDGTGVAGVGDDYVCGADDGDHGGGPHVIATQGHLLLAPAGGLVAAAAGRPAGGLLVQSREAPLHDALPRRLFATTSLPVLVRDHLMHHVLAQRRYLQ